MSKLSIDLDELGAHLMRRQLNQFGGLAIPWEGRSSDERDMWCALASEAVIRVQRATMCHDCGQRADTRPPSDRPAPASDVVFCYPCARKRWPDAYAVPTAVPVPGTTRRDAFGNTIAAPMLPLVLPDVQAPSASAPRDFATIVAKDGEVYHIRRTDVVAVGRQTANTHPEGSTWTVVAMEHAKIILDTTEASHNAFLEQMEIL